jgi:hypothetical protein
VDVPLPGAAQAVNKLASAVDTSGSSAGGIAAADDIPDRNGMGSRASSVPDAAHAGPHGVGHEEPPTGGFPFAVGATTGRDYGVVPEQALPSPAAHRLSPHSPQ